MFFSLLSVVAAVDETVIPDWTKWIFFFVGALVIGYVGWTIAFCICLPLGLKSRILILILAAAGIGLYGYFFFGPWWGDAIAKM